MTKILVVDNYDSFVYTLNGYLLQLGADTTVMRNDDIDEAEIDPVTTSTKQLNRPVTMSTKQRNRPVTTSTKSDQEEERAAGQYILSTYSSSIRCVENFQIEVDIAARIRSIHGVGRPR